MKNAQNTAKKIKPLILIILDGWGIAQPGKGNALSQAKIPTMLGLAKHYPHTELCAHGRCVGLPDKQEGNSEAGHMNIGAGRIVYQDVVKIGRSINNGTFFKNPAFLQAIKHVEKNKSNMHLMGLLSNGMSAHSDPDHLLALLTLLRGHKVKKVYLHLFTDGRDSPQHAALALIKKIEPQLHGQAKIATIMGRYYGMDRKKNWEITKQAYDVLTCEKCAWHQADSVTQAITESYNRNNTDEFMEPCVICEKGRRLPPIQDNDAVIFFNLRSDRARQITKAFVQENFEAKNPGAFKRQNVLKNLCFIAMTDFGPDLDSILGAYPSEDITRTLPMCLRDLRQYYIAETEKYAHVTYFFNGGYADTVAGEHRVIIDSPDVKAYDSMPAMSSAKITQVVLQLLKKQAADFITVNYACPDMIAHTGNLPAAIKAAEAADQCIKQIIREADKRDARVIVTADHGNIEIMINQKTGEVDTEHSVTPVPFILVDKKFKGKTNILRTGGILGDIAPTILELFGRSQPKEMTGKSLLK
ncbi:phosphoglycerate mutase (2,3-diphosphoglycerate-independent) [Candidatus Falkowbacteria bacterium RIFOXYA2_FULL_47_9]|uniref:2,3-bisphosphoglycerate-independent phosphoglycerate mutase n=1 Tax=Candidatus Falkowbacteria bacterium RIFOXYA2_FULL_47_9 TaxID=1797995 RepID=A0A1F5SNG4_9BACT|nr:MAG: phosphoglycerate mutase (2,3-diphosphoglycerate-independent) [Candidatus Falkowbacteria bacterium RIFOXYA2_FULL_47_9]